MAFYIFTLIQARVTELESLLVERVPLRRRPVAILEDRTLGMSWNLTLELWNKLKYVKVQTWTNIWYVNEQ